MKTLLQLFMLIVLAITASCSLNEEAEYKDDPLVGSWIEQEYTDSTFVMKRAADLKENDYGFTIKANHQFEERKNSGWCGTPPISYADFEGTWSYQDSILQVEVEYWGGMATYTWKVMMVDQDELIIYPINEEYELNKENI
jgi:hypothetical protein